MVSPQVFPASVVGVHDRPHLYEQAAREQASRLRSGYESHEFSIPILSTNVTLSGASGNPAVNHGTSCSCGRTDPAAFAIIPRAQRVAIRQGSAITLTVRFNSSAADLLTVSPGESFEWSSTEVTEIYFTNPSGSVVIPVKIVLA